MASNTGKGKSKKANKKTIPLSLFQAEDTAAPQGFNVVSTRTLDWADSVEDDLDDKFTLNWPKRQDNTKVLLPTAPKATRGPDIDMDKVPTEGPFKAYIGNLPYDVNQEEIIRYFSKLNCVDVTLPHNNGRLRGFAYAEFPDRQSLIDALSMNGDTFRNRQLRVGLAGDNDNSRENNREDRGPDRTATNWRSGSGSDSFSRDNQGMRNGMNDYSDRSGQRNRDDYGRRPFESSDRGFRSNDRGYDRGFEIRGDRDRDSRSNNYQNDRSYDRPSDRSSYDRPNNRYESRYNDRSGGHEDSRDGFGYDSNERSYGRRYDDRQPNRPFSERRNDRSDNRRDYGFDRRGRDDSQYDSARNTSPPPSRHSEEGGPKERPKLQLQPRSKPVSNEEGPTASSAIFGGAKPVNTAKKEQQIEEKLMKEKEDLEKKRDNTSDERIRRISSGSNHSTTSRSRKGSESGRDLDDDYRKNGSHRGSRSRKTSERSDISSINENAPKYLMTRNKESNNSSKIVSVRNEEGRDPRSMNRANNVSRSNSNNSNNMKRRERDNNYKSESADSRPYRPPRMSQRSDEEEEERKEPAYTTVNKFAHLPTEDIEDEEDGPHTTSD